MSVFNSTTTKQIRFADGKFARVMAFDNNRYIVAMADTLQVGVVYPNHLYPIYSANGSTKPGQAKTTITSDEALANWATEAK